jgi:hypothetical protein
MASGSGGNGLGRGAVHESVHVARLADIRILTELAREVAASGAERQYARARVEMIERLLLNRMIGGIEETCVSSIGGSASGPSSAHCRRGCRKNPR